MRPVLMGLCVIVLCMAGMVSASLEDCPTCVFDYDSGVLIETNPYANCPTCIFAYGPDGLLDPNPYANCPTCVFAYDSNGLPITNTNTGCSSCTVSSATTNTLGACPSCSFTSPVSPAAVVYTFPDGTPIPEDYLCPIHGFYCPDDPRPLSLRPGYVAPAPTVAPLSAPRLLKNTNGEVISLFRSPSSLQRTDNTESFMQPAGEGYRDLPLFRGRSEVL